MITKVFSNRFKDEPTKIIILQKPGAGLYILMHLIDITQILTNVRQIANAKDTAYFRFE